VLINCVEAAFGNGGGQNLKKLTFCRDSSSFEFVGKFLPNLEHLTVSYKKLEVFLMFTSSRNVIYFLKDVANALECRTSLKTLVLRQSKSPLNPEVIAKVCFSFDFRTLNLISVVV
jgi:hypothetical protein